MGEKARSYTPTTIKKLYSRAHNVCSFPGCEEQYFPDDATEQISAVCHIRGANEGSPRYNENMDDDQRRDYENLILLCLNHHKVTDDEEKYTVRDLELMKIDHELEMGARAKSSISSVNDATLLAEVINRISSDDFYQEGISDEEVKEFDILEKIKSNNIQKYQWVIDEYKVYQGKINTLYEEIEQVNPSRKDILLNNIKKIYLETRDIYCTGGDLDKCIKENADRILHQVESVLEREYVRSSNKKKELYYEELTQAIRIIMVDAFMRCKILEEPSV